MKISYAILVKDELKEVDLLINQIRKLKTPNDEIVVVIDVTEGLNLEVARFLAKTPDVKHYTNKLNNSFSDQRNFLISKCEGDWIFTVDADELIDNELLRNLHVLIKHNGTSDVIKISRKNLVLGITDKELKSWNWTINERGFVNFPDWQPRIFRNNTKIKYEGSVHEKLIGFDESKVSEIDPRIGLVHEKTMETQKKQNEFYQKIILGEN